MTRNKRTIVVLALAAAALSGVMIGTGHSRDVCGLLIAVWVIALVVKR